MNVVYKDSSVIRARGLWWLDAIEAEAVRTAPPLQGDVLVVTSGNDARHSEQSLHYEDCALDLRFLGERPGAIAVVGHERRAESQHEAAKRWGARLARRLGSAFDVVLESNHLHVEYDPEVER